MLLNTPAAEVGWYAPSFELPDPTGQRYTLESVMGEHGLLVAFICNHCPYVKSIVNRIVADADLLQSEGIGFVAINSNDYAYVPEDSPERMLAFASDNGFGFPYLVDDSQDVAKRYGAVCTPDFFGLDRDGVLQYRGRLDDAKMTDASARRPELVDAMLAVKESGAGPHLQHASMGCSIKWK